ncbi:E4 SUMO-protein ligase PIAL2 isoform X2 [Malania oleifera]|uniref:E4 SUMO-protein ligase PIAL2 isoform X2 n=1 Tax=Malania oleifera TaxID=397392 RepID=UPI0025AE06D9|nr:E4 SUMO-protein ligase PIAL2 isoform X2 [Malania oleifera]
MTGPAMSPVQAAAAAAAAAADFSANQALSASLVNSFRVAAVADRLSLHVRSGQKVDTNEFFNLCLSLARGIDYAVANNEIPSGVQVLPFLLKQVCQCKSDFVLHAAIMVLMISVKNACRIGWFSDKDTGELLALANEMGNGFCSMGDVNFDSSYCIPVILKVMSRFYPRMKIGQILASLEVKPGYGAFVVDFHISKNAISSPLEKIRLFVVQTDNIEVSSCIISPPQVNFLLNGKGVERRTNISMDSGPQIPTNVTAMLKYGTNLLQAVGQFNGNYIIAIAFMSVTSTLDMPVLQDYVQPVAAAFDADSELIEGPSRISLNCPISYTRIKIPVKGHSCKHLQCFDFQNFVEINTRRPSWRCPHCNQYVCYTDVRIDQNMLKVLREMGENVADVIISADGSWKAVSESNDTKDQPHDQSLNCQEGSERRDINSFSNAHSNVLDLTEGDDEMDSMGTCEIEERKPSIGNMQNHFVTNPTGPPQLNSTSEVNQNNASQVEDDYWAGIFFPDHGSSSSAVRSDAPFLGGISGPSPANTMLSPVLTDAITPALNREPEDFRGSTHLSNSLLQNQLLPPDHLQLQQLQFGHSLVGNEYGRFPAIQRHVSRSPIAIQALPAQTVTPGPQQRSRIPLNPLVPTSSSIASQASPSVAPTADGFNTLGTDVERQQHISRSLVNPVEASDMTSSSLHHLASQNWNHRDRSFISGQPVQHVVGLAAPTQLPVRQNSHPLQSMNRMPHSLSQPPSLVRSSTQGPQGGVGHTAGSVSSQHAQYLAAAHRAIQRAAQVPRQSPSVPVQIQTCRAGPSFPMPPDGFRGSVGEQRGNAGGMVQPVSRADGVVDLTSEQNWRPTGRMRGSLSGQAYSAALSQFMIIQPTTTQAAQSARPQPTPPTSSASIPPQLQAFLANSRNPHVPHSQ